MLTSMGGAVFGGQLGSALGSLAGEVLSAGDIGLPLGPAGTAALIPANIAAYGEGLEIPEDQVRLYVALREAAHQRLFGHVPWLRGHVLNAVETYAQGIKVDREAVEEAVSRIDPTDPESMRDVAARGHLHRRGHAAPEGRAGPAGDRARPGRGLGLPRGATGPARERLPDAVRPGRDVPPSPRRRRPGRADVRRAGRPGTAPAAPARGDRAVGRPDRAPAASPAGTPSGATPTCCRPTTTSPTRRRSPGPARPVPRLPAVRRPSTEGPTADAPADRRPSAPACGHVCHRVRPTGDGAAQSIGARQRREQGAGRVPAFQARVEPGQVGALRRRCQPDAGATSVACGASRRSGLRVTVVQVASRQPGRRRERCAASPSSPAPASDRGRRHRAASSAAAAAWRSPCPGRSGASAASTTACSYPSACGGREH